MAATITTYTTTRTTFIPSSESADSITFSAYKNGTELPDEFQRQIKVYVNSCLIPPGDEGLVQTVSPVPASDGYFVVYVDAPEGNYTVEISINSAGAKAQTVIYTASSDPMFEEYRRIDNMVDDDTSFMLLRTNPKLTGNVKVVVDSNGNLYLDTFKVSRGLSQFKYRKLPVNPDEYYGRTLMAKFRNMPVKDFYMIENSCYNLFSSASDLDDQYYDTYNCGVRTNGDKLYRENFSLLAPLCVKRKLPDFFLVFKVNNYEEHLSVEDGNVIVNTGGKTDKPSFFIDSSNCEIVKCFDMREGTDLGKYLRNIIDHNKDFVGDIFPSESNEHDSIFTGISMDRGVVTKCHESGFDSEGITNQVEMNNYYTSGYERNHLVSKDIINLEFMFDDPSEPLFSITNYYGLYIRLNGETLPFSCIDVNEGKNVFDTTLIGEEFPPSKQTDMIYGISTPDGFERLTENIFDATELSKYKRKPYTNISTPIVTGVQKCMDGKHLFASVLLNDVMEVGEHYRVIDSEDGLIYDVLMSNAYSGDELSPISYDSSVYNNRNYSIQRISILNTKYRSTVNDEDKADIMSKQCDLIAKAFNSFQSKGKMTAFSDSKDSFSILIEKTNLSAQNSLFTIEKVLSICGYNQRLHDKILIKNTSDSDYYDDQSSWLFGVPNLGRMILSPSNQSASIYFPAGFESLGYRLVYAANFIWIPSTGSETYPILLDTDPNNIFSMYRTVIYKMRYPTETQSYDIVKQLVKIINKVLYLTDDVFDSQSNHYTVLGFGNKKTYYMELQTEPQVFLNDKVQFYQNYPLNVGVCSIFQIKDLYTDVIDSKNCFILSSGTDYIEVDRTISETDGEYNSTDNEYGQNATVYTEENFVNYVDTMNTYLPSFNYKLESDTSLGIYLRNLKNNNHTSMDVSLVSPHCCKWRFVGTDHIGNRMRVMQNFQRDNETTIWRPILNHSPYFDSYWIPKDSSTHIGFISAASTYPTDYSKYIKNYNSFDSSSSFNESLHTGKASLDDLIFYDPDQESRFSKTYQYGKNSIEFVSGGIKIRIQSSDASKINMSSYIGYSSILVCMDGTNPRRPTPFEIFIDETKKQMAVFCFNCVNSEAIRIINNDTSLNYFTVKHYTGGNKAQQVSQSTWKFPDDGNLSEQMWDFDNNHFTLHQYENCEVYILSAPAIGDMDNVDQYAMINGQLNGFSIDSSTIWFELINTDAIKDGTSSPVDAASSAMDTSEMYIVMDSSNIANESPVRTATLTFSQMKNLAGNYSVFIKKQNQTLEYTDSDKIIQMDFVDPFFTEKSDDSSIYRSSGYVHPSYAVPVTRNIIPFKCLDSSIVSISQYFQKCFNAANIMFMPDTKSWEKTYLPQVWLRKVIDLDAVTGSTENTEVIVGVKYIVNVANIYNVPAVNRWYTDSYNSLFYLTNVDTNNGTKETTYECEVQDNTLKTNVIRKYVWSAYDPTNPGTSGNATFDGSLCSVNLSASASGYYTGTISIPQTAISSGTLHTDDPPFRIDCSTFLFAIGSNTSDMAIDAHELNFNTRFYAYDASDNIIDVFGGEDSSSAYFDGWENAGGTQLLRMRLRVNTDASTIMNNIPSYIKSLAHTTESSSSSRYSWNIYVDPYKCMFRSNDRSQLIYFNLKKITQLESYPLVTLTYQGENPTTEMPTEYNDSSNMIDGYIPVNSDREKIEITANDTVNFETTGLTLYKNLNPIIPYWYTKICRLFNKADNYVAHYGAYSGYEKNMFLASRGITLKTEDDEKNIVSSIIISKWFNTLLSENDMTINLDITESVTELIKNSDGYSEAWTRLGTLLSEDNVDMQYTMFKTKYIANTMLKYIIIDKTTPFTLYVAPSSTSFGFSTDVPLSRTKYQKMQNISNSLTHENGRYYMIIKNLEPKQYYATLEIKLLEK